MDSQALAEMARNSMAAIITIFAALLVYQLVRRSTRALVQKDQMSDVMALRLRITARWALIGLSSLIILQQTGIFNEAWALMTAVGAALSVAFVASWSMLSNATAALVVLVYRPFRVGDELEIVEFDGKTVAKGRVVDLNLFFTTVYQESEAAALRIPNNLVIQKYCRVRRAGHAPDPSLDSAGAFFTISPGLQWTPRSGAPAKPGSSAPGSPSSSS
jgi:small-conductance mechanosensitive channel